MSVDDVVLRNHFHLSRECGELTEWLCGAEPGVFTIDFKAPDLPSFLGQYFYQVSPWPVLISEQVRDQFSEIVRELPALMCRCILKFYENDLAGFSARYQVPELAYHLLGETEAGADDQLVRYDLVMVGQRPRLLEANVGTNIGGWQISWLWQQLADNVKRHPDAAQWSLSHTSPAESFLRHVHRATHAHVGAKAIGNVLLMVDDFYLEHGFHQDLSTLYQRIAAETNLPGKLLFACDLDGLTFNAAGRAVLRGEIVDCVLMTASSKKMGAELSRAHVRRLVFYPDNAIYTILGDKINFAVMHAMRSAGKLCAVDSRLVEQLVPWSAFLTEQPLVWGDRRGTARELSLAHKDELVLKRGFSFQGKDVYVGRFQSEAEWARAIAAAGTSGDWLVQEYCEPDRLYAPAVESGAIDEHDVVWGVFGFGRDYGGSWGRMMKSATGEGVVNSARGAKEFLVLEV